MRIKSFHNLYFSYKHFICLRERADGPNSILLSLHIYGGETSLNWVRKYSFSECKTIIVTSLLKLF